MVRVIKMEEMLVREKLYVNNIPAIVWGEPSQKVYIYVHGKMSYKESAEQFAELAMKKGYQTISFDLPEHGERHDENYPCDVWNGCNDLNQILDYAQGRWENISLYACSIGAHFALYAYQDKKLDYCMFQSPILDINQLIHRMFRWFHLSEEALRERKVIKTPFHVMTWDYYTYILEHPIERWETPTNILYGTRDEMQTRESVEEFASKYGCELVVAENSFHGFAKERDLPVAYEWMETYIK